MIKYIEYLDEDNCKETNTTFSVNSRYVSVSLTNLLETQTKNTPCFIKKILMPEMTTGKGKSILLGTNYITNIPICST